MNGDHIQMPAFNDRMDKHVLLAICLVAVELQNKQKQAQMSRLSGN